PLTTAGGLMFRGVPDGLVEAYDARTGVRRWAFQTVAARGDGASGSRVVTRPGPAVSYELDGTQFIAVPMGRELWAFSLDGPVAARGEPVADPWADLEPAGPAPRATRAIETATLIENPSWSIGGRRYAIREHDFSPVRAQVVVGVPVRVLNNGEMAHTIAARDASWTTETLEPAGWEFVTFDEPGTFLYHCVEHPWAIGEVTVVPVGP
ncbi:MAG: hypothetical protein OSB03_17485, partial [Vicinamibacterales bacterium]|nr:hypothetical protein [Vicinamibacterales bacterium]